MSDAFEHLAAETIDAIVDLVTPEEITGFVAVLSATPQAVEQVRRALLHYPWFCTTTTPDTQRRRMRTLRDAAVAAGHPVCSTNAGYFLGTHDEIRRSAERARRFADGALRRAQMLDALAARLTPTTPTGGAA
jgi:alkanesulfonate monooxygenase SsuD/methylene tetrahydromethanopterin reductase-like flavin-dependent oxidoreductase (luciferase family)